MPGCLAVRLLFLKRPRQDLALPVPRRERGAQEVSSDAAEGTSGRRLDGPGRGTVSLVWLALVLVASPGPVAWSELDSAGRTRAIGELRATAWPARLEAASARFLGTPYLVSPLGEGAGQDPDPLLRLDAVDCLTMVEQSLALGAAEDDASLVAELNRIRYTGEPSYANRNHVMEAQWLPHLVRAGRLREVTREYGGATTRRVTKVITSATWRGRVGRALALAPSAQATGRYELDLVPRAHVLEAVRGAPSGLVVAVVRADRASVVTRISHVGVLVQTSSGTVLRHASSLKGRVVDEPLSEYLRRNGEARWELVGVALYEPQEAR